MSPAFALPSIEVPAGTERRWLPVWLGALVAAALFTTACGGEDALPQKEVVVTDSAGVRIVENPGAASGATEAIPILATRDLQIGMRDGPDAYQFSGIMGATRLQDGAIAVLNRSPPEVRVFHPDGQIERTFGAAGEGPGEFRSVSDLRVLAGDTFIVFDPMARRFTLFDREGEFVRTTSIENSATGVIGFLDARTAITERPAVVMVVGQPIEDPQFRTPVILERVDLTSQRVDSIGVFGGRERYRSVTDRGGLPQITTISVPFTVDGRAQVKGGKLYLTDGRRPEIRVRNSDGELEAVIRVGRASRPVRDSDVDRWVRERVSRVDDPAGRAELQAAYADMVIPADMPHFDDLVVTERGHIWAREYGPFPGELTIWTILGPDGRVVGRARLPADLEVLYGDSEMVLGVVRDELDVEYLVRMRVAS